MREPRTCKAVLQGFGVRCTMLSATNRGSTKRPAAQSGAWCREQFVPAQREKFPHPWERVAPCGRLPASTARTATPTRAAPSPANRFFHETRNTNHETRNFCCPVTASLLTISRHYLGTPHPQPIKGPPAVHRSGWASRRAPFVRNPGEVHRIPDPTGKCTKRSIHRSSRRPGRAATAAMSAE